jgi:hypothetical protein
MSLAACPHSVRTSERRKAPERGPDGEKTARRLRRLRGRPGRNASPGGDPPDPPRRTLRSPLPVSFASASSGRLAPGPRGRARRSPLPASAGSAQSTGDASRNLTATSSRQPRRCPRTSLARETNPPHTPRRTPRSALHVRFDGAGSHSYPGSDAPHLLLRQLAGTPFHSWLCGLRSRRFCVTGSIGALQCAYRRRQPAASTSAGVRRCILHARMGQAAEA